MVYNIFRKNLLFKYDFLIDYGRHKSRTDNLEQPRSLLDSQIYDIFWSVGMCGVEIKILHLGRSGGEKRKRGKEKKNSVWR